MVMGEGEGNHPRIRDGVGEVVGDGCLSLDVGTRALYIGMGPRKQMSNVSVFSMSASLSLSTGLYLAHATVPLRGSDGSIYFIDEGGSRVQR